MYVVIQCLVVVQSLAEIPYLSAELNKHQFLNEGQRGTTLMQDFVLEYNRLICRTRLTTTDETCDLSKGCQQVDIY